MQTDQEKVLNTDMNTLSHVYGKLSLQVNIDKDTISAFAYTRANIMHTHKLRKQP